MLEILKAVFAEAEDFYNGIENLRVTPRVSRAEIDDHLAARALQPAACGLDPRAGGWEIVNDTPLPVVCFTHRKIDRTGLSAGAVLEKLYDTGTGWISQLPVNGVPVLRACITSFRTRPEDVACLVGELDKIFSGN